jgi:hypothetical protein
MRVRWNARPAGRSCLLVCALGSALARAEDVSFVVSGSLAGSVSKAARTVVLYAEKSSQPGGSVAVDTTRPDGTFKLAPKGAGQVLRDRDLWVVCFPQGDVVCKPHQVTAASHRAPQSSLAVTDVELMSSSLAGSPPPERADALAALAETHEVLAWAGVEDLDAADGAVKTAVARADTALARDQRERFKAALATALAPLRLGSHKGLPLLPSLQRDDFAEELIAAAPGWRWLTRPERNDQLPAHYGQHDGRFEGYVIRRVGSTFADALVSLSEGPLSVDPETRSSLDLTWPASAGPRVCLDASPMVPGIGWKMRRAANTDSVSYTWDLSAARDNKMKKDTLGITARSCSDADRERGPYIPVRAATSAPTASKYRLVFLFTRPLTNIYLTVLQGEGDSQRMVALPPGTIKFDPSAREPTVTVDVPTANLDPGPVYLEMSGRGPGRFGPERLAFLHLERAGK